MQTFFDFMLLFFAYSAIGWACECIYCSVPQKRFINRGFLTGPICPVYGFGALLVLFALEPLFAHPVAVFFGGVLLTSALEYPDCVIQILQNYSAADASASTTLTSLTSGVNVTLG